ncbi:nitroreductase family protein [Methylibium sp.]|uniref:nitroreductase family protein n=1 Tax=Methylibium sp. TaxID=2067992 RepID=UPI003D0E5FE6
MPPPQPPQTSELAELALALITSRFSVSPKRLAPPGPSALQLQCMVEAAGCAPDHELLRPWRLVRIAPAQRAALGDLFVRALLERDPAAPLPAQAQARDKAFRAPELLLAVARLEPVHANVPPPERYVALGAGLMNLLLAAHGQGFGAMLTSGLALRSAHFAQAFGLDRGEEAVCFVAIGTATEVRRRRRPSANELMTEWSPSP